MAWEGPSVGQGLHIRCVVCFCGYCMMVARCLYWFQHVLGSILGAGVIVVGNLKGLFIHV